MQALYESFDGTTHIVKVVDTTELKLYTYLEDTETGSRWWVLTELLEDENYFLWIE